MVTNDLEKDFMGKALEDAVWKTLSNEFAWNEALMEKYRDKIDWKEILDNSNMCWSISMLEKFQRLIDWDVLSNSSVKHLFTQPYLEKFAEYWNWSKLSENRSIEFTHKLIDRFADKWDWKKLINNWGTDNLYNEDFLIKFSKYIPGAELQSSRLWLVIVELKAEELKSDILANI